MSDERGRVPEENNRTGNDPDVRPRNTEVDETPTVASVAAVASTTDDLEAAEPAHPDRPVEANVDTADTGLDSE